MRNRIIRAALPLLVATSLPLSGCSSSPVSLWPFGGNKAQARSQVPADATEYRCSGGKRFYVRMLDGDAAAWLILPEREVRLNRADTSARYTNGITVLEINGSEATLADGTATAFAGCKAAAS